MANFDIAYKRTEIYEGGYSNRSTDNGGETYRGISRVNWPQWTGWKIVDSLKTTANFPKSLDNTPALQDLVRQFYLANFWNKIQGDNIPLQDIANEVYDCAVNSGISRAITFLQTGLNVLNKNQTLYTDIVVDGSCGPGTLKILNAFLAVDKTDVLHKTILILRGNFYVQIAIHDLKQEEYVRGWLHRVVFT